MVYKLKESKQEGACMLSLQHFFAVIHYFVFKLSRRQHPVKVSRILLVKNQKFKIEGFWIAPWL